MLATILFRSLCAPKPRNPNPSAGNMISNGRNSVSSAFFIRRSRDPFHRYLQFLGPKNEWFFPCPPWEKERVEIQNGVGWHQHQCPLKDFFEREGVSELTRAYCDMDLRIADLLPDHIELKREKVLCCGDDYCDFLYYRKQTDH